jgi:hypothetical protein
MTVTIQQSTIDNLEHALDVGEDFEFRTDYSGRFMYGRECVGFVSEAGGWAILNALYEYRASLGDSFEEEYDDVTTLIENTPDTDSMGMSTIYYWRHVEVAA